MDLHTAITFLQPAIPRQKGVWADIGAGTGTFTQALDQLLEKESTIYAIDKNVHPLQTIRLQNCRLIIEEIDFTKPFQFPLLDGILMANALHYAKDQITVLKNLLESLQPDSPLILIEYELTKARSPWVPYPIPFKRFQELAAQTALSDPVELNRIPSSFGHEYMYLASAHKK